MLSKKVISIIKNFAQIRPSFMLDSKILKVMAVDESVIAIYDTAADDGMVPFDMFPAINASSIVNDMSDLVDYTVNQNDDSIIISGKTKGGVKLKNNIVKTEPSKVSNPSLKFEAKFNESFTSCVSFKMAPDLYDIIIKSSSNNNSDTISFFYNSNEDELFLRTFNKDIPENYIDIEINDFSINKNNFDNDMFKISIQSIKKMPKDNVGYKVDLKAFVINQENNEFFPYSRFSSMSIDSLRYYISIVFIKTGI